MAKIITKSNTDEIAGSIARVITNSPTKIVRIEGVCGSGKTTIGRKLAANGIGLHIEVDKFATKPSKPTPYPQCLKLAELNREISRATQTGKTVILDAVCLEEVAPAVQWGRGLRIYVKQLSFNSIDPTWHVGFQLEDEPPTDEPHRSVHLYHLNFLPHMNADLIVEYPEEFHRFPQHLVVGDQSRKARHRCRAFLFERALTAGVRSPCRPYRRRPEACHRRRRSSSALRPPWLR
jgi:hypothetical protein